MFSFICARINGWVNNGEASDLRRHRANYDVTVMISISVTYWKPWVVRLIINRRDAQYAPFGNPLISSDQTAYEIRRKSRESRAWFQRIIEK